jgi:hypothetical protein
VEEISVVEVGLQEGQRDDGTTWSRYKIKDGNDRTLSYFKGDDNEQWAAILKQGNRARVEVETKELKGGRKVNNITAVEAIQNGSSVPETYSHQRPDGEADWDKVAIGKTRCALWMHYLNGQVAASVYVKASNADGVDALDAVVRAGVRLVVAAEKDTFERPPGDDGIPF